MLFNNIITVTLRAKALLQGFDIQRKKRTRQKEHYDLPKKENVPFLWLQDLAKKVTLNLVKI